MRAVTQDPRKGDGITKGIAGPELLNKNYHKRRMFPGELNDIRFIAKRINLSVTGGMSY